MDELILAALQQRISAADAARLDAWRQASPENEQHFREMAVLWSGAARPDPLAKGIDVPAVRDLMRDRARPLRRHPYHDSHRSHAWRWASALGGIAAALLISFTFWRATLPEPTAPTLGNSEFVTDTAEMATARLDDGSVVRLAPRSRLRVSHAANARDTWLDGEAYFAVTRDESRPFRVRTRAGMVEVLGTRFDLRVEASNLRLVVTEGLVAVATDGDRREVAAGEIATVDSAGTITIATVERPAELLAWTRGFMVFQDTPLRQVAVEIQERYGIKVLLPDSAIASRTITAWFTHQNVEQVLTAVCRAVQAHCSLEDGVASIEP